MPQHSCPPSLVRDLASSAFAAALAPAADWKDCSGSGPRWPAVPAVVRYAAASPDSVG